VYCTLAALQSGHESEAMQAVRAQQEGIVSSDFRTGHTSVRTTAVDCTRLPDSAQDVRARPDRRSSLAGKRWAVGATLRQTPKIETVIHTRQACQRARKLVEHAQAPHTVLWLLAFFSFILFFVFGKIILGRVKRDVQTLPDVHGSYRKLHEF